MQDEGAGQPASEMYDMVVIGGGIVGLSTAWQYRQRHPDKSVLVLEKEDDVAQHQTGHNSGVIHAGIYYAPNSLKAKFCREGLEETIEFCEENDIAYDQCGKLIVATNDIEHERMLALYERGLENQLDLELLSEAELNAREPNIVGTGAILVKSTAIVDYRDVCKTMAKKFGIAGGTLKLGTHVTGLTETEDYVEIQIRGGQRIHSRFLICCTGLQADRMTRMMAIDLDFQIVPYRGEYYQLPPSKNNIVQHLIYPVPDPDQPFLGVHLTRVIDGSVTVGPNALQGWKREGYGNINVSISDTWDMLTFSGFWRATFANLKIGLLELKNSLWKPGYLRLVQKYCPSVVLGDLLPYRAGVRAQAVMSDGSFVHDFLFAESERSLHVCNAPSPAATSALPIGRYICDKVDSQTRSSD